MKVLGLLDYLQENIEMSPKNLVGKITVNKKEVLATINEIRRALPDELEEAKNLVRRRDTILSEAHKEEAAIIENSRKRAQEEYENCDILLAARREAEEILQKANSEANEIKAAATKEAKELRYGVMNYADSTLSTLQKDIDIIGEESLKVIQNEMEEMLIKIYKEISSTTARVRENNKELGSSNEQSYFFLGLFINKGSMKKVKSIIKKGVSDFITVVVDIKVSCFIIVRGRFNIKNVMKAPINP